MVRLVHERGILFEVSLSDKNLIRSLGMKGTFQLIFNKLKFLILKF